MPCVYLFVYSTQNLQFLQGALWSELLNLCRMLPVVICLHVILKELLLVDPSKEEPKSLKNKLCHKCVRVSKWRQATSWMQVGWRHLRTQIPIIFLQNSILFFRSVCLSIQRLLAEELIVLSREAGIWQPLWRLEGQKNFFAVQERLLWYECRTICCSAVLCGLSLNFSLSSGEVLSSELSVLGKWRVIFTYGIFSVKVSAEFLQNFLPLHSSSCKWGTSICLGTGLYEQIIQIQSELCDGSLGTVGQWFCPGDGMTLNATFSDMMYPRLNCGDIEITTQRSDECMSWLCWGIFVGPLCVVFPPSHPAMSILKTDKSSV